MRQIFSRTTVNGSAFTVREGKKRQEFIANLLRITDNAGTSTAPGTRLLWLPKSSDTTTTTDASRNARVFTYSESLATFDTTPAFLGSGLYVDFNGTDEYATVPDAANLSFGTDVPFSVVVVVNPPNSSDQTFISKHSNNTLVREWIFSFNNAGRPALRVVDESAGVEAKREADATVSPDGATWFCLGATYDATGGATAANGMLIYSNGAAVASTATNNASYVAMEDTAGLVALGAINTSGTPAWLLNGSMALAILCSGILSADQMWNIKEYVNSYYGLSL